MDGYNEFLIPVLDDDDDTIIEDDELSEESAAHDLFTTEEMLDRDGNNGGAFDALRRRIPSSRTIGKGCVRYTTSEVKRRIPIIKWLPSYNLTKLFCDIVAGLTVGLTVIPQALAYASVAGVPPQYGLYSSFMGPFTYVPIGSTSAVSTGPTALLSLITYTYSAANNHPVQFAVFLCFMNGFITGVAGLLNLGFLIDFISMPVMAAFTSAAALTIASTQLKTLFGLSFSADGFLQNIIGTCEHISKTRPGDAIMSVVCIIVLLLLRKLKPLCDLCLKAIPSGEIPSIGRRILDPTIWLLSTARNAVVVIVALILAYVLSESGYKPFVLTGNITQGLPMFTSPPFSMVENNRTIGFTEMIQDAGVSLAILPLLSVMEHVAIARTFAQGKPVDCSQELFALGVANVLGSCVGSIPVTGSFTRSCVNHASGVRTPMGGLVTGSLVLLALSFLTPTFYYIPKSTLSAVIICAVIFMVEYDLPLRLWRSNKLELVAAIPTFLICLFAGSEYGMAVGIVIGLFLLMYDVSRPKFENSQEKTLEGIPYLVIRLDRAMLFPSVNTVRNTVDKIAGRTQSQLDDKSNILPIVLDFRLVEVADYTALQGLADLSTAMSNKGHILVIWRANDSVQKVLMPPHHTSTIHYVNTRHELHQVINQSRISTERNGSLGGGISKERIGSIGGTSFLVLDNVGVNNAVESNIHATTTSALTIVITPSEGNTTNDEESQKIIF